MGKGKVVGQVLLMEIRGDMYVVLHKYPCARIWSLHPGACR